MPDEEGRLRSGFGYEIAGKLYAVGVYDFGDQDVFFLFNPETGKLVDRLLIDGDFATQNNVCFNGCGGQIAPGSKMAELLGKSMEIISTFPIQTPMWNSMSPCRAGSLPHFPTNPTFQKGGN